MCIYLIHVSMWQSSLCCTVSCTVTHMLVCRCAWNWKLLYILFIFLALNTFHFLPPKIHHSALIFVFLQTFYSKDVSIKSTVFVWKQHQHANHSVMHVIDFVWFLDPRSKSRFFVLFGYEWVLSKCSRHKQVSKKYDLIRRETVTGGTSWGINRTEYR